jgi:hypothetical protein
MKPILIRRGLIGILLCFVVLNSYKTKNFYNHPDYPYDARNVFIAGNLWLHGENPYNDSLLKTEWQNIATQNKLNTTKPPGFKDCGMIYPFWSIPILVPYYLFSWPVAKQIIWLLSWLFIFIIAWFASKSFHIKALNFWFWLHIILAFKSSLVAVTLGQPLLMSMAAIMASWYFYTKNKEALSGLLLGIAMLKVTLCIPFVVLFLANKKWKLLIFSSIFPVLAALSFYQVSGNLYIPEMLKNMATQMQINYAGSTLTSVNTNLTEFGILLNYFGGIDYKFISVFNVIMMFSGILILVWFYFKGFIKEHSFLGLLILWNLLFSYHLIYDCLLLVFLVPLVKTNGNETNGNGKWIWLVLLAPLFLPINGLFKNTDWIQFHLPVTILALFLYLVYASYQHISNRGI